MSQKEKLKAVFLKLLYEKPGSTLVCFVVSYCFTYHISLDDFFDKLSDENSDILLEINNME